MFHFSIIRLYHWFCNGIQHASTSLNRDVPKEKLDIPGAAVDRIDRFISQSKKAVKSF